MDDPHSYGRTRPIPPDHVVESTARFVAERLRDRPDLVDEIREFVSKTCSLSQESVNPATADTVSIDGDSSHRSHGVAATPNGNRRFGDYELIQELARGGMGIVYKARQLSLDRIVALKMILSGQLADADDVRRFRIEARASAALDHTGIVPIFEIGEHQGQHFFAMGLVEGRSLAEELREGPMPARRAAEITRKVAEAIGYAHSRGVIHRDLKPGNVLLDQAGEPKVTDFGLAKRTDIDSQLTGTGQIMGTPAFMPPEQALGLMTEVREPADVYSLGATLYCLLTRRPPFQAANPIDTLRQVIEKEPLPLRKLDPSLPKDLETICLKCLRKDAAQRYRSAQALADDLGHWLDGEPIHARPVGRAEKVWLWCKRKPMIAALSAAILGVVLFGSALFWERQNAARATVLVESLAKAEPSEVRTILTELQGVNWWAVPRLREQLVAEGNSLVAQRLRLHARLGLAAVDPSLADNLVDDLLAADFRDVANVRDALERCPQSRIERLWALFRGTADDRRLTEDERFRAGLALAGLDTDNIEWRSNESSMSFLVDRLVATNPVHQPLLWDMLHPLRRPLTKPLRSVFIDPSRDPAQRLGAANAFADLVTDDVESSADLLTFATSEQFDVLFPMVAPSVTPTIVDSLAEIAAALPPEELGSTDRIAFGQRRANAAVTLLRLGERERVLSVFDQSDDPEALTQFIFRCKSRGVGVESLLELLEIVTDRSAGMNPQLFNDIRYALLLAIGEYGPSEIPSARREAFVKRLSGWYESDPSSGVHGAAGWLLRHLGEQEIVTRVDQIPVPYSAEREWFTLAIEVQAATAEGPLSLPRVPPQHKRFYYTFIVFPPGESTIGSPADEPERWSADAREERHPVKLTRPFAILDREITMEELIAFDPVYIRFMQQHKSRPDDGGFGADWYDSVTFCRWLGAQMGLAEADQAYGLPQSLDKENLSTEPALAANAAPRDWPLDLDRRGFRLPTDAEWEIASRDGSRTAYGFGGDVRLLERFGWYSSNSGKRMHPSKELRPSRRGLFDIHGNLFEWTHDWYAWYGTESVTDPVVSAGGTYRVSRGGSWDNDAVGCRTAFRRTGEPAFRTNIYGFRIALTPSDRE
jgi:formylglycine-generating enzyme required for sulfatase activity